MSRKQHASIVRKYVGCNNVIYFSRIRDVAKDYSDGREIVSIIPRFTSDFLSRLALCLSLPAPFVSTFRNGTGISGMTLETARASALLIMSQRGVYFSRGVNCESTAPHACPPVLRVCVCVSRHAVFEGGRRRRNLVAVEDARAKPQVAVRID